jgi:lipopolysaccharide/colanic/teichoic acid biosynthesis glycosyltransferase
MPVPPIPKPLRPGDQEFIVSPSPTFGEKRPTTGSYAPAPAGGVPPQAGDAAPPDVGGRLRPAAESVLAAVLLASVVPVLAVAALLIKLTSRGPVMYTQTRVGRVGRRFVIYKLRTMRHNCEAASGVRWATTGDSRVTRVGRLLRATHIDELPQLVNVIRGHMSLVGPRPERPEIVAVLVKAIPDYSLRHEVRPGVTGLAQIQLPADTDLENVRRKLALDLVYIRDRTLWLDVRIVVGTLLKIAAVPFPWIRAALGLPGAPADETVLDHPSLGTVSRASGETALEYPVLGAASPAS